jgi:sigma-B regulation protein RsbU (phosphoserine phosphatase)
MRAEDEHDEDRDWLVMQDRALAVASEGITIADARHPDRPLIYVNEGFERLTGYRAADVLGRNCKFLQGRDADPSTIAEIRRALEAGTECTVEIRNRRQDGTPFWNRLSITPVRDDDGVLTHFIGVQSDVTERRETEEALRRANRTMRRNLDEAAAVQQAWLPRSLPDVPGYEFAWQFRPCDELAGDALNIMRLDEHRFGVYVLDVSGHGVPAALLSMTLHHSLAPSPEQSLLYVPDADSPGGYAPADPATVAMALNRQFSAGPQTGKFFTILYGVLDLRDGHFRYVTAGHPPPARINADGVSPCPLARGVPIGYVPEFTYEEESVHLEPGDRLVLYSDGALEATDANDQELGEERLLQLLAMNRTQPPTVALETTVKQVEAWCAGGDPQDDITFVAIEVRPD